MSLEALTGVPQRSLHTSEQSSGIDTAGILAPTRELATIELSGEFYRLPRPQKPQRPEEQPRIACGSGAQFGGGEEEKVQVITLSPENGASDGLADLTIVFYVLNYPYDTTHMFHEGPVALQ